ncbi:potassium voltage-gated channel subfamily A member 7-like isoform X3 [Stylophora pistillata]|uniref:potassium voltage-gated channel subfamily A member 7-like isoform X3 n=1 Tax=Stylophora pistillata TaxID=50429 RepID=UPI000C04485B|nr:potassium voltage-gated channel subfamily A member 7-like isoform X3 [Stylophora pistillata]
MLTTAATSASTSSDPNGAPGSSYQGYKKLMEKFDGLKNYIPSNMDDPIVLNVGGKRFETYEETLARFPDTLLGSKSRRSKFYNSRRQEYFFDRHRSAFDAILYYYQSGGTLIRPEHVPPHVFINEVVFYDLPEEAVQVIQLEAGIADEPEDQPMPSNYYMGIIWNALEYPNSSKVAKFLAIFSVLVITLSLIIFCVETLPTFKMANQSRPSNATDDWKPPPNPYDKVWFQLNTFVIVWFTGEYVIRFICSPQKLKFLLGALNLIDLLSILPYYVQLGLKEDDSSISVLRVVRVVRVFRVFKLSRHSRGLQILGNTLKASLNELIMLMFFLAIGVMIFASCVYYAEGGPDSEGFQSIPHAFWWAVVTMTTVGYGDVSPVSLPGKIVGALCAISGVLTIALPVPVIVSNFENFYNKEMNRRKEEELKKAEEAREKGKANKSGENSRKQSVELENMDAEMAGSPLSGQRCAVCKPYLVPRVFSTV